MDLGIEQTVYTVNFLADYRLSIEGDPVSPPVLAISMTTQDPATLFANLDEAALDALVWQQLTGSVNLSTIKSFASPGLFGRFVLIKYNISNLSLPLRKVQVYQLACFSEQKVERDYFTTSGLTGAENYDWTSET